MNERTEHRTRRLWAAVALLVSASACGQSPTTASPTKVIGLSGNLAFGEVLLGSTATATVTISNSGTQTLTVTGITVPNDFTVNWTSGTISAGASVSVAVTFAPTVEQSYDGTMTVSGDQTSGTSTIGLSGTGVATIVPTRVIALSGTMVFGNILVASGLTPSRTLTISNGGNSTLTVTGITTPGGFTVDWASGTIAPSGSQFVLVTFAPATAGTYDGPLTVMADHTDGTNTIDLTASAAPRVYFGAGQYLVGGHVAAGRYFSAPSSGCYWERQSGLGGTPGEILASGSIGFDGGQWIVDILPSDVAFKTLAACGIWYRESPRRGAQATISPGAWLVGTQIEPGTYRATAQPGCYWERLRDFTGEREGVIASNLVAAAGSEQVTVLASDAGFAANAACGTWTR